MSHSDVARGQEAPKLTRLLTLKMAQVSRLSLPPTRMQNTSMVFSKVSEKKNSVKCLQMINFCLHKVRIVPIFCCLATRNNVHTQVSWSAGKLMCVSHLHKLKDPAVCMTLFRLGISRPLKYLEYFRFFLRGILK